MEEATMFPPAAKPYAKALYELATERNIQDKVLADAEHFQNAFRTSPKLRRIFCNAFLGEEVRLKVGLDIAEDSIHPLTLTFLRFLSAKKRLSFLPQMLQLYKVLLSEGRNEAKAVVFTARPLDKSLLDGLARSLRKHFGKVFEVQEVVQGDLRAGIRIQIGDRIIDGSLRNQLRQISERLLA